MEDFLFRRGGHLPPWCVRFEERNELYLAVRLPVAALVARGLVRDGCLPYLLASQERRAFGRKEPLVVACGCYEAMTVKYGAEAFAHLVSTPTAFHHVAQVVEVVAVPHHIVPEVNHVPVKSPDGVVERDEEGCRAARERHVVVRGLVAMAAGCGCELHIILR